MNAFLLVDKASGMIIETINKEYVIKRFDTGICTISNCISIGNIDKYEHSKNIKNLFIVKNKNLYFYDLND